LSTDAEGPGFVLRILWAAGPGCVKECRRRLLIKLFPEIVWERKFLKAK